MGVVDYTLAKRALLRNFRQGLLSRLEICDAHPELLRAAKYLGESASRPCPVCRSYELRLLAYVYAQLLYCLAGVLVAGITREPTAFQGDSLLLPSVAVVVLGGTSLLGGRGFPISTVIASFFLNQLSQFALAVGVPYSAQTIIQALALGFGIGVYSIRWTVNVIKQTKPT